MDFAVWRDYINATSEWHGNTSWEHVDENFPWIRTPSFLMPDHRASLLTHRNFLRETTAYPVLRKINLLSAIVIVVLSFIWGSEVDESVAIIFGAIGIIVATLSYSITSVFYDVADSTINISKNSD